jgi:hypothetical protein
LRPKTLDIQLQRQTNAATAAWHEEEGAWPNPNPRPAKTSDAQSPAPQIGSLWLASNKSSEASQGCVTKRFFMSKTLERFSPNWAK